MICVPYCAADPYAVSIPYPRRSGGDPLPPRTGRIQTTKGRHFRALLAGPDTRPAFGTRDGNVATHTEHHPFIDPPSALTDVQRDGIDTLLRRLSANVDACVTLAIEAADRADGMAHINVSDALTHLQHAAGYARDAVRADDEIAAREDNP